MLCDECKKRTATYHFINKINGVTRERHLCSECYKNSSSQTLKLSPIGDLMSSFFSPLYGEREDSGPVCSVCGTSSDEFLETGYLGCPNCYKELSAVVMPTVQKLQSDVRHRGKSPAGEAPKTNPEVERLRRELGSAVAAENYEKATELMEKIKNMTGEK